MQIRPPWDAVRSLALGALAATSLLCRGGEEPAQSASPITAAPGTPSEEYSKPVSSWLEAQIALARADFSCGSIDGVGGYKSGSALKAYQQANGLDPTGSLDPATKEALVLKSPPLTQVTITEADLARLQPVSPTWLGKSQQTALDYETALELVAENAHSSERLIKKLNPTVDWANISAGTRVIVPDPIRHTPRNTAAKLEIVLSEHTLEAFDSDGKVIAHFPVSIAAKVEKRPVGELHVITMIPNPNYTFDPEVFPESEEAKTITHKLTIPPGPNNPVGLAWIGLDRTGYGIHGTPSPEKIGITESHGCFRLTNWDAQVVLQLVCPNLSVFVEP